MTDPLVILPNMEAVVSQFLRDQPEIEDLVDDRVFTAIPVGAGRDPLIRVVQIADEKLSSRPLWIVRTTIQIEAYGGSKAQASTLARTAEGVLALRGPGVHPPAVIVGVDIGAQLDLPDDEYEPARPRFLFSATITAHPLSTELDS